MLALRLYTTPCFRSINTPLRTFAKDAHGKVIAPPRMANKHKMPITVFYVSEAIKQLRALEAKESSAKEESTAPKRVDARHPRR